MDAEDKAKSKIVEDPWANRNIGMRCSGCIWFVNKASQSKVDNRGAIGRCRRHAPTMNGFPVVFEMDWCGDHRMDENKL